MLCKKFDFAKEVSKYYGNTKVISTTLKEVYNVNTNGRGCSTAETKLKGVYALFLNGNMMKIGKATDKYGIFHRMSQYYRCDKKGGLKEINKENRDKIEVLYFNLCEAEIWFAERRFQVLAHDYGEKMPWECISRN